MGSRIHHGLGASNPPSWETKGYFLLFLQRLWKSFITRRLKRRTRLPAEVTNSDRSDAVAMVTTVSWETPKGCHGIPSPIPLGPRSSRKKKLFPDGSSSSIPQDVVFLRPIPGSCPAAPPVCPTKHPQAINTSRSTCPSPWQ